MFQDQYWVVSYIFSSFFNLVENNWLIVEHFSNCRENGMDLIRNGQLRGTF